MSDQSKSAESKGPGFAAALREYLERVDRGELVNREEFIARHPDVADELRSFFLAEQPLRNMAATRIPENSSVLSTRTFAAQGQETVLPRQRPETSSDAAGSGLTGPFGRYQITRALGQGTMGSVYLAQDSQLKRPVAIKVPRFEEDPTGELLQRFFREAEAAATLRHANICPVYDVGQIDGKYFISMAYIEGRPLSDLIKSGKIQHERHVVLALHKLAKALQQAHDQGIVHRDLKPANIMVDRQGEPIIMDFGLARKRRTEGESTLTQSGVILGSPAYMSPEQIEGDPDSVGPASDQYSLGVVLYEMLTGQLPFRGSMAVVLAQIITKGPTPPGELRPGLDPRIEAVCLRMMAKKAADRFPSMKAVADQLAAIAKNPAAASNVAETSPTATQLAAAPAPSGGGTDGTAPAPSVGTTDGTASQIRKSVKQKALPKSDLATLEEAVRKCQSRGDYDRMIQIIERIPDDLRNDALRTLLEQARTKIDAIALLICEVDEADRLGDAKTALHKAEELLRLKPGHHRARRIQEKYSGFQAGRAGGAARLGLLSQFRRPWNEWGWIPWTASAAGLAVCGAILAVILIHLNKTVIVVDVKDPGVVVEVKGTEISLTGPTQQKAVVEAGEKQLKIRYAGLEALVKSFELTKGQQTTVKVYLAEGKLIAELNDKIFAERDLRPNVAASGPPPVKNVVPEPPQLAKTPRPAPAETPDTTPISVEGADRRAAEGVLALDGSVSIQVQGQDERKIKAGQRLPPQEFELTRAHVPENASLPDELLDALGNAHNLVELDLRKTRITDAALARFKSSTRLQVLFLSGTQISDAGLADLEPLVQLERLALAQTRISDAGLIHLSGLTNLHTLWLDKNNIGDAGLVHLDNLRKLTDLRLSGTRVTDAGLVHLQAFPQLKVLLMGGVGITDAGLTPVGTLRHLTLLGLNGCRVTDAGLANLQELTELEALRLHGNPVSDAGVPDLAHFTHLNFVDLTRTKVTKAGVARLHEALPNCRIRGKGAPR